jgi:autotransporter-associated beta strand protein
MKPRHQNRFTRRSLNCGLLVAAAIIVAIGPARASTWNVNSDGNWSDAVNWVGGVPDGAGSTASLMFNIYTSLPPGPKTYSGINTYAGATAVNEGTLSIKATGTINSTSGISIGAGVFNYNSATALAKSLAFKAQNQQRSHGRHTETPTGPG